MIEDDTAPLMATIREKATLIRWLANNAESFPADAWTKSDLISMLCEIFEASGEIIVATGVPDLEAFTGDAYFNLQEERGQDFKPYNSVD